MATKKKPNSKRVSRPAEISRQVPGKRMPVTVRDPLTRRVVKRS